MFVAKKQGAFTMMEIMIAVIIIGFLAVYIGPNLLKRLRQASETSTKTTLVGLKDALFDYKQDIGHFPTKQEGKLEALIIKPNIKTAAKWDGPYLQGRKEVPLDAWNQEIEYNSPPQKHKDYYKEFELISLGDGKGQEIHDGI